MRLLAAPYNTRPSGAILVIDPEVTGLYSVTVGATQISITDGSSTVAVDYVGKSIRTVVTALNASPFPVEVRSLADVQSLRNGELLASGATFPNSFDVRDRTPDGKGAIIRMKRWTARYKRQSSVELRAPYRLGAALPWWPRIDAGTFVQSLSDQKYVFSVPEYETQVWSDKFGRPFRDVDGEPANFVRTNQIRVSRAPLLWKNNITLGTQEHTYPSSIIKDVDEQNGIIYLNEGVTLPEDTQVFYTYLERSYEYKALNVNAHFTQNPFILDKYVVFYARPTSSTTGISRDRGIYHEVGESVQDAINEIEEENQLEPIALLGAINVRMTTDKRDTTITDTRTFGGGLHENELGVATEKKFPRSQYFFDIGRKEGIPYPGAASVVVELPPELKEVMTVAELKTKASKFLAAGVYPIFQFPEEKYDDQFTAVTGNVDISLFNGEIDIAYNATSQATLGFSGDAARWWNTSFAIPANITGAGSYNALGFESGAGTNTGENQKVLELQAGTCYYHKYLKGPADAVFSWEERPKEGQWERKTVRDDRPVSDGALLGGMLKLDSELGYKEVRNLTGFSPYVYTTGFWDDLAKESAQIIEDIRVLSQTGEAFVGPTGYVVDVVKGHYNAHDRVDVGEVVQYFAPLMENYDVITGQNFYSGDPLFTGLAHYIYDSTTQANTTGGDFPRAYSGDGTWATDTNTNSWNTAREIQAWSRFLHGRVDEYAAAQTADNSPAVIVTDAAWINGTGDALAGMIQSGLYQVVRKSLEIAPYTGGANIIFDGILTDAWSPFFNPSTDTQVPIPLVLGGSLLSLKNWSEVNEAINKDWYLGNQAAAFGALYSSMTNPIEDNHISGAGVDYDFCTRLGKTDPASIALSGTLQRSVYMMQSIISAAAPISAPARDDTQTVFTWLNYWNRFGGFASEVLDDTINAMKWVDEGNTEWAGNNTGAKTHPHYHSTSNPDGHYLWDVHLQDGDSELLPLGGGGSVNSLAGNAAFWVHNALDTIETYIQQSTRRGGVIQDGYPKLIRQYLRVPLLSGQGNKYFNSTGNVTISASHYTTFESTFEECADAYIRGMVSEDGLIEEGTQYAWNHAPFTGYVPSEALKLCADAIEYYRHFGNTTGETKWTAIAEGLFRTMTGQLMLGGGYPETTTYDVTTQVTGDPGLRALDGYMYLLRQRPNPLSDQEFQALTGSITTRLTHLPL